MQTAWSEVYFGRGRAGSIFGTALESWYLSEQEYAQRIFWKQPKDDAVKEALTQLSAAGFTRVNRVSTGLFIMPPVPRVALLARR